MSLRRTMMSLRRTMPMDSKPHHLSRFLILFSSCNLPNSMSYGCSFFRRIRNRINLCCNIRIKRNGATQPGLYLSFFLLCCCIFWEHFQADPLSYIIIYLYSSLFRQELSFICLKKCSVSMKESHSSRGKTVIISSTFEGIIVISFEIPDKNLSVA